MDPKKLAIALLLLGLPGLLAAQSSSAPVSTTLPDTNLPISSDAMLEEGKALYENGQYIAALGKFMSVLRKDPHQPEARQYLRMVIDVMRENPAGMSGKSGVSEAAVSPVVVQEELRQMLRQRSLFTLDLKAIPGVQVNTRNGAAQVEIDTSLLFADQTGGLKEQAVPILDRVAVWLKTFGQQPVIIHCYPEELQDPSANGSLFLHRYSELYNFFVDERKLAPQRFVSADLLVQQEAQKQSDADAAVNTSTLTSHVLIETVGSNTALLDAMPSTTPQHELSRWLELSIMASRGLFNPEEGEWANLDLAALTRTGLRNWKFTIAPTDTVKQFVMQVDGKGNLLKRISWDGHDQKTGSFVPSGSYLCRLTATDSDGTIQTRDVTLQIERTTADVPVVIRKPKRKHTPPVAVAAKPPKTAPPVASVEPQVASNLPSPVPAPVSASSASSDDSDSLIDTKPAAQPPAPSATEAEAASPEPADSGDAVQSIWKQVIEFEPDQSDLKPTLKASLERISKTLEVYPLQKVRIVGFAATSEANAADLAQKRAETVRSILVDEYHVDAKRVIVAGGKTTAADGGSKVEMSITN